MTSHHELRNSCATRPCPLEQNSGDTTACGVPQDSVLSPKTFIAYTQRRSTVFSHSMAFTIRDTQMTHRHTWLLVVRMHRMWHHGCRIVLKDVSDFCASRRLQLNPNNIEITWFGSSVSLHGLPGSEKCRLWKRQCSAC